MTLADTLQCPDPAAGHGARPAGAAADGRAEGDRRRRRSETAQGWMVEASHDAYVPEFGLSPRAPDHAVAPGPDGDGRRPAGARPGASRQRSPFAVRFHIHPDVRMSRLEGGAILLKLPGGEGWRFRAGGGELDVEESIYLGGEAVRRAEQLVVQGTTSEPCRSCMGVRADSRLIPPSVFPHQWFRHAGEESQCPVSGIASRARAVPNLANMSKSVRSGLWFS